MGIKRHCIILAAGDRSLPDDPEKPSFTHISKMFAPLGKKTVIWWVVARALSVVDQTTVIIKPKLETYFRYFLPRKDFGQRVLFAFQPKAKGSADALRCAYDGEKIPKADNILLLMGDQPLFSKITFNKLFKHQEGKRCLVTIATMEIFENDPDFAKCGAVEFDKLGNFRRITKRSSVTTKSSLWHAGPYVFNGAFLEASIRGLPKTFEGEQHVYLVVEMALAQEVKKVGLLEVKGQDALGVDTVQSLIHVREAFST